MKCPYCNSFDTQSIKENTFICKDCEKIFHVAPPRESSLSNISNTNYNMPRLFCPMCGIDTLGQRTHKCHECGRENICAKHMRKIITGKYTESTLCLDCISKSLHFVNYSPDTSADQNDCIILCNKCKKNAIWSSSIRSSEYKMELCYNCEKYICEDCVDITEIEKRGIFRKKTHTTVSCPFCGSILYDG